MPTRVALILGGRSGEHSISCISAASILRAVDRDAFDVVPVGITIDGRVVLESDDPDRYAVVDGRLPEVDGSRERIDLLSVLEDIDVAFPVLHGPWGEDGTVQGLLEVAGVPYVGSGVLASAACMDKVTMKALLAAGGLPVGPSAAISDREWLLDRERVLARLELLGLPLFVKPSRAGSSVGISKVSAYDALAPAIDEARRHDPRVIVEASAEGAREIECGVLAGDDGVPRASVCAEIRVGPEHEFYTFEAKYLDDSADLIVPAPLPDGVQARVQEVAVRAFEALGCEGLARVDFFVAEDRILVNEINTMPGFTSISMFPRMWEESGIAYPALVDRLLRDAMRRGTGLR